MRISVVGTGYVGLVTAAIFADFGHEVWGVDVDQAKIESLKSNIIPFYEPGLKELVSNNIKNGRLNFTTDYRKAISNSQIIFICVGTPSKKDGGYDLSYVFSAAKTIAENLKNYAVICIKSTVPPSTAEEVKKIINQATKVYFDLASCPEFLREGSAVEDSFHPSRIIIGAETKKAQELLIKLHQSIKAPLLICDIKSAQMIKYAANAFLATKISFINSIANLCEKIGADIDQVAKGLGMDPRIGDKFLKAGLGYGGSCFPKDTWALIKYAQELGYDFTFLKEVDNVNNKQIDYFIEKIKTNLHGLVKNKTVTILGLAFKPDTDDIREARSIVVINKLKQLGAIINVYDPIANDNAKKIITGINLFNNPYQALKNSSALILITEWLEFKNLDFKKIASLMKEKIIIDGRNFFNPGEFKKLGFIYVGIGRKNE